MSVECTHEGPYEKRRLALRKMTRKFRESRHIGNADPFPIHSSLLLPIFNTAENLSALKK